MIELRVMELIFMWMAPSIRENGTKINNMGMERKVGQMVQNTRGHTNSVKKKVKDNFNGLMEQPTKENLKIIT